MDDMPMDDRHIFKAFLKLSHLPPKVLMLTCSIVYYSLIYRGSIIIRAYAFPSTFSLDSSLLEVFIGVW